eukprot:scaffold251905_cov18-Tisochrysis_lutea.AAC.1
MACACVAFGSLTFQPGHLARWLLSSVDFYFSNQATCFWVPGLSRSQGSLASASTRVLSGTCSLVPGLSLSQGISVAAVAPSMDGEVPFLLAAYAMPVLLRQAVPTGNSCGAFLDGAGLFSCLLFTLCSCAKQY